MDIRWQQRFQNFSRAFVLLRSELESKRMDEFNRLEQEGLVQRFEVSFELAWKTLKDYLEYAGLTLDEVTARKTIKKATTAGILEKANVDPEIFISMLLTRNTLSHQYDFEKFAASLQKIQDSYLSSLNNLHQFFVEKQNEDA